MFDIFAKYYSYLINNNDISARNKISMDYANYVNNAVMGSKYCPCIFSVANQAEQPDEIPYFCKGRKPAQTQIDVVREELFDRTVLEYNESSQKSITKERVFKTYFMQNASSFNGVYNVNSSPDSEQCKVLFENATLRFFEDFNSKINPSGNSTSIEPIKGCEDLFSVLDASSEFVSKEEITSAKAACNGDPDNAVRILDSALSFGVSRFLSEPANFMTNEKYLSKIYEKINPNLLSTAAQYAIFSYFFFSSLPGLILSRNVITFLLKKALFSYAASKAAIWGACLSSKFMILLSQEKEEVKRQIYRDVIVILVGVDIKNYTKSESIMILGNEYYIEDAEENIDKAYDSISRYMEKSFTENIEYYEVCFE